MRKSDPKGWEYELTIPYEDDKDLEDTIYGIIQGCCGRTPKFGKSVNSPRSVGSNFREMTLDNSITQISFTTHFRCQIINLVFYVFIVLVLESQFILPTIFVQLFRIVVREMKVLDILT
jgi:hypothetical protein